MGDRLRTMNLEYENLHIEIIERFRGKTLASIYSKAI